MKNTRVQHNATAWQFLIKDMESKKRSFYRFHTWKTQLQHFARHRFLQ